MSNDHPPVEPVRKSVTVPMSPDVAFELFTSGIATWWPLATHSVGLDRAASVSFPSGVGDELVETLEDGSTSVWGTVLKSDPPNLITISWHAGRPADDATLLELTFTSSGGSKTTVELVHSGWERWADGAPRAAGYSEGWDVVLGRFTDRADAL